MNSTFWKIVFLLAGLYTAGGVLPGIINPEQGLRDFTGQAITDWHTIYFFRSLWITVFIFGIGYFLVALKPSKQIGIVIIGFLCKFSFATQLLYQHLNGKFSQMTLTISIVDLGFVVLFGFFIFSYYQSDSKAQ
jgi:hypothetical protein